MDRTRRLICGKSRTWTGPDAQYVGKVGHGHDQTVKHGKSRSWTGVEAQTWEKYVMDRTRRSNMGKLGHGQESRLKHGESRSWTGVETQIWEKYSWTGAQAQTWENKLCALRIVNGRGL